MLDSQSHTSTGSLAPFPSGINVENPFGYKKIPPIPMSHVSLVQMFSL